VTKPREIATPRIDLSPTQLAFVNSKAIVNVLYSNTGEGKSARAGTKIIMFDGSTKNVEDLECGDLLMGDDSTPRKISRLATGLDQMFEIIPVKGESFVVNGGHILALKRTRMVRNIYKFGNDFKAGEIVHITVNDFLSKSSRFKHIHKLYRVGVEFPERKLPIPPYLAGIWLGDGTRIFPEITSADHEIVSYLKETAKNFNLRLVENKSTGSVKCKKYRFSGENSNKRQNRLLNFINDFTLNVKKHIPLIYKANSRRNRLELLAGLIDTDGWLNHQGYQIIQKEKQLAEDIAFVARSLGLAAYVKPRIKKIRSIGFSGTYYHVMISGDCSEIPVRINRKKCSPRKQKKDVLVTGIKEVRPIGIEKYYGFVVDRNHHFLFGDFTVTHNTFAAIIDCMTHARNQGVPIRGAIVRDTHQNIKTSTVPSIEKVLLPNFGPKSYLFKDDFKLLTIFSNPRVVLDLFGIDDPTSLGKLQGPEYAWIMLEEPAPIAGAGRTNAGLSEDVFNAALVRCTRQEGTVGRLVVTMNPADEDHWTYRRFFEDPAVDPDNPLITRKVFRIKPGENIHVSELSRQAVRSAYKNDPASFLRYAKGEFAPVYRGKKVTPEFDPKGHVHESPLVPAQGLVGFRMWDGYSNPCVHMGQITQTGRAVFIDTHMVENSDIRVLIETKVLPSMGSPKWKDKCKSWRDIGDISMMTPDQSNKQESAGKVVETQLHTVFERGPSRWEIMKIGLGHALRLKNEIGLHMVVINPEDRQLIKALDGAWSYKTDPSGNITSTIPQKDKWSHIGDAFANGVNVLFPSNEIKVDKEKFKKQRQQMIERAQSYST
jgi:intein/homing endonuclease